MLQLRTAAATRSSTLNVCQTSRTVNARLCAPLKVPSQQLLQSESKVGPRGSSLALQAHRGDEVAAFLVASDIQDPGVLPGTAPREVRLSYAGKELSSTLDSSVLELKPGVEVVQALQRFQGGGAARPRAALCGVHCDMHSMS
ncbi:hypothetical protein OEZ85_012364 [Tetradesmus obliquus]|uniref:Uncharacterized protein n=1 Tax=Tetradesmus obliquus TaxID=3088 RepID=A0ABY8TV77_TETOB|nr:hypothetical protein OEZ85_012364 [Tetradesmus obliquus]